MGVVEVRQTQGEIDHPKDFKTKTPQVGRFQRGIFQTVVVRLRQPLIFLTFEKFKSYSFKIYFSSKMWSNLPRCTVLLIKMPKYYFFCNLFNQLSHQYKNNIVRPLKTVKILNLINQNVDLFSTVDIWCQFFKRWSQKKDVSGLLQLCNTDHTSMIDMMTRHQALDWHETSHM